MDYALARQNMVDCQLRTNKVTDSAVLAAMAALPREAFLPEALRVKAYSDGVVDISQQRSMMAPMTLARILQSLEIDRDDVGLVVASTTGYAAAVMGHVAGAVFGLSDDDTVTARASELCTDLRIDNVVPVTGPLTEGWPKEAPYDVILINGAIETIPDSLFEQLKEGGRLGAIVSEGGVGRAKLFLKTAGGASGTVLFDAQAQLLSDFMRPQEFVF
jgi:protein-L-isoaspartate(D-aspartate) O-methyltransferase